MTHVIKAQNVNYALEEALQYMRLSGVPEDSRNGPVLVAPGPVITEYLCPTERILFHPVRDANPVFHLLESLWMLAGRNDVEPLLVFNSRMGQYAEADGHIHGAYGHRWRRHFGMDQLHAVVRMLTDTPNTRQAVLEMWDASWDLVGTYADRPCNTHAYFDLRGGVLNMTVCCRSNDMLWGAYGANVVHFSVLQELIAHAVGAPVGVYRQMSNNFHIYTDLEMAQKLLGAPANDEIAPYPATISLLTEDEHWTYFVDDCEMLFNHGADASFRTHFFKHVVVPLAGAYVLRKMHQPWMHACDEVAECDWKYAFLEWANRRENKAEAA